MSRVATTLTAVAIAAAAAVPVAAVAGPLGNHPTPAGAGTIPQGARAAVLAALAASGGSPVLRATVAAGHVANNGLFGTSVAVSGRTLVVGAPNQSVHGHRGQGAVYVFVRPSSGWSHVHEKAVLTVPDGRAKDYLGYSVAVSGRTIVAGTPFRNVAGDKTQGAAYVWSKPSGGWGAAGRPTSQLLPTDGTTRDRFGTAVAASGHTVAVAAPGHVVGFHQSQGAVYVFSRSGGRWPRVTSQAAELVAHDGRSGDQLGYTIAMHGTTIVAGAPYRQVGQRVGAGAAYVFVKAADGWRHTTDTTELTMRRPASANYFGNGVAVSSRTIVVDAPYHKVGTHSHQGAAYVFTRSHSGWAGVHHQVGMLTTRPGATNAYSGAGLAVRGRTVVVCGYGLASVFREPAGGWSGGRHQSSVLVGQSPGAYIGKSVAVDGRTIVAGAPNVAVKGHPGAGAAYVFTG